MISNSGSHKLILRFSIRDEIFVGRKFLVSCSLRTETQIQFFINFRKGQLPYNEFRGIFQDQGIANDDFQKLRKVGFLQPNCNNSKLDDSMTWLL